MSAIGIYLFRHVRTSQILVSWKRTLTPKHLEQIQNVTQRPPRLRKDLWKPLVAAVGLEDQTARGLCQSILRVPATGPSDPEAFMKQPKKTRALQELDQTDDKVAALCKVLAHWQAKGKGRGREAPPVALYWDRLAYKDIPAERGLAWPDFVSHHALELRRGRLITNEELNTQSTVQKTA
ncbi:hypothetical protein THASP1DRAFT_30504 [Thamnocephalis sphaerospora]|uniref:Uncharacterized protein n=1 Tax=Thamnocephalis sphaerospora TaxID=78915 RepID=A0A4P9XP00_9FUNG|nr:hypothetical protein THASP1DRAFT_30504 [Thamnocephalis sphaerospora]|eukprot:RKP07688.1 hypothetical protein THASP1DRAFT_30504 [Thamnocephalis sphaerospora]